MIGMMYLVLTALLALNVQKEILDAFVLVDDGLTTTKVNFEDKNNDLYTQFETSKVNDPGRFGVPYQKAQEARAMANEIVDYIHELKIELLMETDGLTREEADTISLDNVDAKDNFDTPTNIMIGGSEDGTGGKAHELRNRLQGFKDEMLDLLTEKQRALVNLGLEFKGAVVDGAEENWEMHNFYHMQLAPDIVLLSKLQVDVRNIEYDVVSALMGESTKTKYPFDTLVAKVVAPSNYILLGEEYQADVFVAAYSTTQAPEMLLGDYDSITGGLVGEGQALPVEQGIGSYRVPTDREGLFTYEGVVNMKDKDGNVQPFPFKSEYMVARPSATVSAEAMKVFYRGVDNPVKVSVPGVPDEQIRVSISKGRISRTGQGTYTVDLTGTRGTDAVVSVSAVMEDGTTKSMGSSQYRIKNLPKPYASFAGKSGSIRMKSSEAGVQQGFAAKYGDDFVFNLSAKVTSYQWGGMKPNGQPLKGGKVNSNRLDSDLREMLKNGKAGTKIYIEQIRAKGSDGIEHKLDPIIITLRN